MKRSDEIRARMARTGNTAEYVWLKRLLTVLVNAGK